VDLVRSLGADRVIDYTKEDFAKSGERYDVMLDNVPNHTLSECRQVLKQPNGRYVLVGGGGPNEQGLIGPLARPVKIKILSLFVKQPMGMILAELNHNDLAKFAEWMEAGKVTPVIDRKYKLAELSDAIRYLEEGHARGKVIITVD
jgi:NADPH:quinone reductase-like Zn-dependent oxidoreductase